MPAQIRLWNVEPEDRLEELERRKLDLEVRLDAWIERDISIVSTELLEVRVTADEIIAYLVDGRVVSVPLAWSWRLSEATPSQRANFRLIGTGQGIHWPEIDEDISIEGMLHGEPARRPRSSAAAAKARSARGRALPNKRMQPTGQEKARG